MDIKVFIQFKTTECDMKNYFTIKELTYSSTAKQYGIDNTPSKEIEDHLNEMIVNLLNPLREAWGSPIIVTSGYRCNELNIMVGGVKTSAHKTGYAVDIKPKKGTVKQLLEFTKNWLTNKDIKFDQCIDEYGNWVHLGYKNSKGEQRCQYISYR